MISHRRGVWPILTGMTFTTNFKNFKTFHNFITKSRSGPVETLLPVLFQLPARWIQKLPHKRPMLKSSNPFNEASWLNLASVFPCFFPTSNCFDSFVRNLLLPIEKPFCGCQSLISPPTQPFSRTKSNIDICILGERRLSTGGKAARSPAKHRAASTAQHPNWAVGLMWGEPWRPRGALITSQGPCFLAGLPRRGYLMLSTTILRSLIKILPSAQKWFSNAVISECF